MEWYYILGIISYAIFIVQSLLSVIGSDFDFDIDVDGDIDFNGGDIFSFKGFLHFSLGFTTWLMSCDHFNCTSNWFIFYGGALISGFVLMYLLGLAYKLCMKLNYTPEKIDVDHMIGIVYLSLGKDGDMNMYTLTVPMSSGTIQVDALSEKVYNFGDKVRIKKGINGVLYIDDND